MHVCYVVNRWGDGKENQDCVGELKYNKWEIFWMLFVYVTYK